MSCMFLAPDMLYAYVNVDAYYTLLSLSSVASRQGVWTCIKWLTAPVDPSIFRSMSCKQYSVFVRVLVIRTLVQCLLTSAKQLSCFVRSATYAPRSASPRSCKCEHSRTKPTCLIKLCVKGLRIDEGQRGNETIDLPKHRMITRCSSWV